MYLQRKRRKSARRQNPSILSSVFFRFYGKLEFHTFKYGNEESNKDTLSRLIISRPIKLKLIKFPRCHAAHCYISSVFPFYSITNFYPLAEGWTRLEPYQDAYLLSL